MPALGRAGNAELRRVGLGAQHHAAGAIAFGQFGIVLADIAFEQRAAVGHRPARNLHADILDEEWHALERPVRQLALGHGARFVIGLVDDRVQSRIVILDARNGFLEKLERRHLALAHQMGQAQAVVVGIFGKCHGQILSLE